MEEMKCKSHNRFGPLFNKRFVRVCLHLGAAIKRHVEHKEARVRGMDRICMKTGMEP